MNAGDGDRAAGDRHTGDSTHNAASNVGQSVQSGAIHGDVHFHAAPEATTPPRTVPRQLPVRARHFINRAVEQDALTTLLGGARSDGVVLLSTVDGIAGVGKSTLVVHWSHGARDRFPDGDLYVNLRGFDPVADPMEPGDALAAFLAALDVPAERVPEDVDARAALFRSMLHDRRMLVVLDNAHSSAQVRPLLPGTSTSFVLVTSRNRLDELVVREGATRLALDVLDSHESRDLLAHYLGEDRLADEQAAAAELIEQCAGLPLALGIVAVRAAENPEFPLDEPAEELRTERDRLDALDAGGETGVRAVFSWSYRSLSDEAARMFRLLGLPTGPDISLAAAADLAGTQRREARRTLAELTRANLLTQHEPGRYQFHDLLRAYAAECAAQQETESDSEAALRRLFDHYLRTSYSADRHYVAHARESIAELPDSQVTGLHFEDHAALDWWDAERENLLAAARQSFKLDFLEHAWQLPYTLMYFLKIRHHIEDSIEVFQRAIEAARKLKNRVAEATVLHDLGVSYTIRADFETSAELNKQSITIFEELGDRNGEAEGLIEYSLALVGAARPSDALQPMDRGLHLAYELEDLYLQGQIHATLALVHSELGQLDEALPHYAEALRRYEVVSEELGKGFVLHNRATAYRGAARYQESIVDYCAAIAQRSEIEHRQGEATSLRGLGLALRDSGDHDAAQQSLRAAADLFDELGQPEAAEVRAELEELLSS